MCGAHAGKGHFLETYFYQLPTKTRPDYLQIARKAIMSERRVENKGAGDIHFFTIGDVILQPRVKYIAMYFGCLLYFTVTSVQSLSLPSRLYEL